MLQRIIETLETTDGTVTLRSLAQRLDLQVSALEPMVAALVRADLLSDSGSPTTETCASSCGGSCTPAACPFTLGLTGNQYVGRGP